MTSWRQQIDNEHLRHAAIVERYPNGSAELEAHLSAISDPAHGTHLGKLTPAAARSFQAMAAHALRDGVRIVPTSNVDTFRPLSVQKRIFADRYRDTDQGNGSRVCAGKRWYLRKGQATAACPGTSNHGKGEAIDYQRLEGTTAWLEEHARSYGWAWELSSEEWHIHYLLGDDLPPGIDQEDDVAYTDDDRARDKQGYAELLNIKGIVGDLQEAILDRDRGLVRLAQAEAERDQTILAAIDRLDDSKPGGITKADVRAALADVLTHGTSGG